jgi:tetratricopeptide (TPR) repeat protein
MTHPWANAADMICWVLVVPVLAYLIYRTFERSDDRRELVGNWSKTAVLLLIMAFILWLRLPGNPVFMRLKPLFILFPALVIGRIWTPSIGAMMAGSLTSAFDGGDEEVEAKPYYYTAEGKRRKGLYQEAIAEVRTQLEKFPGDYEGYVKMASIQMENLKNLPAAQSSLNEFLEIPGHAPNEVVSTLHLLADWQLQYGQSAREAAETLQRIIQLYPGTPLAHAAEQRIAHLGSADEARRVRHESKFTVGTGERNIGLRKESTAVAASSEPRAQAEEYVKQLELHPFDTEAREKLAILYAEEFQRMDMAADQLEQLIALPTEPPKHVARWLNLLATLQVKHGRDLAAGQATLRRITERFPGGALADMAVSRLARLQSELKSGQTTSIKPLGAYEKDMGLKHSSG